MKLRTRQYARRQLTWLRKLPAPPVEHVDVTGRDPRDVARALVG
jgi:tRNA dimethylallyltransferase